MDGELFLCWCIEDNRLSMATTRNQLADLGRTWKEGGREYKRYRFFTFPELREVTEVNIELKVKDERK